MIDIIDCSGSGDVSMGTLLTPEISINDGVTTHTLKGITGRTLKLNPGWKNPSGQYRQGIKVTIYKLQ